MSLASGGMGAGAVTIWNVVSGEPERELKMPLEKAHRGIAYSPDGKFLLVGIVDGSPTLWSSGTGQFIRTLGKCNTSVK